LPFAPSINKPLEIDDYVFCPHKKITSRTIRNNGALIVKNFRLLCFVLAGKLREPAKLAYWKDRGSVNRARLNLTIFYSFSLFTTM
jgi:hypothetical protein